MKLLEPGFAIASLDRVVGLDEIEAAVAERNNAPLALSVPGDTNIDLILPWADKVDAILIVFGGFRDGRGFSLASLLRQKGFKGELRASGDLLPDHAPLLARCGFDGAEPPIGASTSEWTRALNSFSAVYQPAADGAPTVWSLRARARKAFEAQALESKPDNDPKLDAVAAKIDLAEQVRVLNAEFRDAEPQAILEAAIKHKFVGRIAVLSSFGAEAAVGLHMIAQVDPATPVLFLDTDRHFAPTLQYRDRLVKQLGLTALRVLTPKDAEKHDTKGDLWRTNPDLCCSVRKVEPLAAVTPEFDALITGRKRFHGGQRMRLPAFELINGQIRVNPLANWSAEQIEDYFVANKLVKHPLVDGGYRSIGCWPCTQPSSEEDVRGGRWSGLEKNECGIHMPTRWAAELERQAS
jgi:phosphoadenosine phosphosulfate reductase